MLDNGAEAHRKNKFGATASDEADRCRWPKIKEMLLRREAEYREELGIKDGENIGASIFATTVAKTDPADEEREADGSIGESVEIEVL